VPTACGLLVVGRDGSGGGGCSAIAAAGVTGALAVSGDAGGGSGEVVRRSCACSSDGVVRGRLNATESAAPIPRLRTTATTRVRGGHFVEAVLETGAFPVLSRSDRTISVLL